MAIASRGRNVALSHKGKGQRQACQENSWLHREASQGQSVESVKVLQPLKDFGKRNRKLTLLKSRLYSEEMGYKDDYYITSISYSIYS